MEVDLLSVDGRADEAVVVLREDPLNAAVSGRLVLLYDSARSPKVILQTTRRGVECVAHRNIDILVGVVFGGITRDHDLAFRHHQMKGHVIELALSVMAVVCLDDDGSR